MSIYRKDKLGGFADVIRCDEQDYLIWKWHPTGKDEGKLKRETAIRTNSKLRVKEGEVAVFFYKQNNGVQQDFIVGPYDGTIKTKNFPVLSSIIGIWYEGDTPFQAEIFFINLAKVVQVNFAVPYFDAVDPRFADFYVPLAIRGTVTFNISDYRAFIANHRLVTLDLETLKQEISSKLSSQIKNIVTDYLSENNLPLVSIEGKTHDISASAEIKLKNPLYDVFAINVTSIDIKSIDLDKSSHGYAALKKMTQDIALKKAEIDIKDYEEQLRINREERQYAQRMSTRTGNIGAYQTEIKGEVGVAGAEALGKMGENGAGDINMGGGGFNPMTIAAGMAVGAAVGKNIANTLNESTNVSFNESAPTISAVYYVAVDNNPTGPFTIENIKSMISNQQIKRDSLIWKQGTPTWEKAESFGELAGMFPPPLL